jgi:hypothetical protein
VYATLTTNRLMGVLHPGGWSGVGAAIWLAYVSGGLVLVYGRAWGRVVLLVGAAASLVAALAGATGSTLIADAIMLFGPGGESHGRLLPTAVEMLPALAILLAALKSPSADPPRPPDPSASVAARVDSPGVDLAYACFTWIVVALGASTLLTLLPLNESARVALGMLVGIHVMMSALVTGVAGVVLSLIHWKEWPLLVMSAIVIPVVFLAGDEWRLVDGLIVVQAFLCVRGFGFTRRRAPQTL